MVSIPLNIINASPWGYFLLTSHESFVNVFMDVVGFITFGAELFALGAYGSAAQDEIAWLFDYHEDSHLNPSTSEL
ncbi:hypothetical protein HPB50_025134 [Hyalomma asiaticum]|uniref:Uncharacterized protein n=1 Tax=Hyalomma asiaticum TaxID=266040 RepID=A0ACB7RWA6_HYAAI|nr:hypothetical protein HPB50_025134 [Hyalomma asiaticum]